MTEPWNTRDAFTPTSPRFGWMVSPVAKITQNSKGRTHMIHFLDGPARHIRLQLDRTPRYLRVAFHPGGNVKALEQLDDQPRPGDQFTAYRLAGNPVAAIYCSRGEGCSREILAEYEQIHPQPPQATMADNEAWHAWATTQDKAAPCSPPH